MSEDHLSNEISISAELTERGVKAGARSRALAAVDRLLGGVVDLANVPVERIAQKGRAKTDAQVAAIKALGEKQLEAIHSDPDFAARAMQQHLRVIGTKHENKTEAVRAALEDLQETPPTEEQNNSSSEQLDDAFLNRWERYAEDATSDKLREKWGRVLAGEIRKPGTFSSKVMRIIDELEPETAALFERVCAHRVDDVILKGLSGPLPFKDAKDLVSAGLIIEPGLGGQIVFSRNTSDNSGKPLRVIDLAPYALAFPVSAELPQKTGAAEPAVFENGGNAALPIYLLSDAGAAIAALVNTDCHRSIIQIADKVAAALPGVDVGIYQKLGDQMRSIGVRSVPHKVEPLSHPA